MLVIVIVQCFLLLLLWQIDQTYFLLVLMTIASAGCCELACGLEVLSGHQSVYSP